MAYLKKGICYNFYISTLKGYSMKETYNYRGNEVQLEYEVLGPSLYVYRNVIPKEWNSIDRIESALAMPGQRHAWQSAEVGYGGVINDARKCKDFKIAPESLGDRDEYTEDMYVLWEQVMGNVKMCMEHYCRNNYLSPMEWYESINIVRYGKGEFFKFHSDDGDPYRCTISMVGYPNDNYEGGELFFPIFDVKHKPQAGDFVFSPSAFSYIHSSEPVTDDGIKYSFVIMSDRNKFAHFNDSPIYYDENIRRQFGVVSGKTG